MPKKKKGPAYFTREEDFKPFSPSFDPGGLKVRDLILTPLGLIGTVLGVKYLNKDDPESGVLWVQYKEGVCSPLEKDLKGYKKCSDAEHIWRDVAEHNKKMFPIDEAHYIVHELNRRYRQGLIDEDNKKKEAAEKKKLKQKKKKPEGDAAAPTKK